MSSEVEPAPFDVRLFGRLMLWGAGATVFANLICRVFTHSARTNETLLVGLVAATVLSVGYTFLAARQPQAANVVPVAVFAVFGLFVPQDLIDDWKNPETVERFFDALPAYAAIFATSGKLGWELWAKRVRSWLKRRSGPAEPEADAEPEPPPSPAPLKKKKRRPVSAAPRPAVARPPEPEPPPRKKPQITTEVPKLRKPKPPSD